MRPRSLFLRVIPTGSPSFPGAGFNGMLVFEIGPKSASQQKWVASAKVENLLASTILPLGPDVIDAGIERPMLSTEGAPPPMPSLEDPSEEVRVPCSPNPFLTVSDVLSRYESISGHGPDVTVSPDRETSHVLIHSTRVEIASWDRSAEGAGEDGKIDAVFDWHPRGLMDAMGA
jgi:hypothetical protein